MIITTSMSSQRNGSEEEAQYLDEIRAMAQEVENEMAAEASIVRAEEEAMDADSVEEMARVIEEEVAAEEEARLRESETEDDNGSHAVAPSGLRRDLNDEWLVSSGDESVVGDVDVSGGVPITGVINFANHESPRRFRFDYDGTPTEFKEMLHDFEEKLTEEKNSDPPVANLRVRVESARNRPQRRGAEPVHDWMEEGGRIVRSQRSQHEVYASPRFRRMFREDGSAMDGPPPVERQAPRAPTPPEGYHTPRVRRREPRDMYRDSEFMMRGSTMTTADEVEFARMMAADVRSRDMNNTKRRKTATATAIAEMERIVAKEKAYEVSRQRVTDMFELSLEEDLYRGGMVLVKYTFPQGTPPDRTNTDDVTRNYVWAWEGSRDIPQGYQRLSGVGMRALPPPEYSKVHDAATEGGALSPPWALLTYPRDRKGAYCVVCREHHHDFIYPTSCLHRICVGAAASIKRANDAANRRRLEEGEACKPAMCPECREPYNV